MSWVDLDLDGNLDLVLANGAIPLLHPKQDAQRVQVLENLTGEGHRGEFADAGAAVGLPPGQRVNGRGLAAADYDNDGDVDVAINSIAGPLLLLRNSGATGHWLEVKLDGFAPGARVTAVLPGGTAARARGPRGQQLPLLGGSARPLRARSRDEGLRAARSLPGRHRDADCANVAANQLVVVTR